jgi:hypothetical protein
MLETGRERIAATAVRATCQPSPEDSEPIAVASSGYLAQTGIAVPKVPATTRCVRVMRA